MGQQLKGKILTVRIAAPLDRRLRSRAKASGVTPSDLVRRLLEAELVEAEDGSPYENAKALIGSLDEPKLPAGRDAKRELRKLRLDRRG